MAEPAKILIVEDDNNTRRGLIDFLANAGYSVQGAASVDEAEPLLKKTPFQIVITDLKMPGRSGMELVRSVPKNYPGTDIIVTTAYGTVETAVEAMKAGAYDYLTKPVNQDELLIILERIVERHQVRRRMAQLEDQVRDTYRFSNIIGRSKKMQEVYALMDKAARSEANILIVGETGTGKELVARAIHHSSSRKNGPLVEVNCAAFPETLLESELFGHVKGAFTGALRDRIGRFEEADKGTLFLDEINNVPPTGQVKLLRALQERIIQRLGDNREIPVDIHLITSSGEVLAKAIEEGRFRADLFYRINVITITLPPLRDRKEDIPYLALHFQKKYADRNKIPVSELTPAAMALLINYPWVGNVRELENAVEYAVIAAEGQAILPEHLPPHIKDETVSAITSLVGRESGIDLPQVLQGLERYWIEKAVADHDGNITRAAAALGVPLRTMMRRVNEYKEGG